MKLARYDWLLSRALSGCVFVGYGNRQRIKKAFAAHGADAFASQTALEGFSDIEELAGVGVRDCQPSEAADRISLGCYLNNLFEASESEGESDKIALGIEWSAITAGRTIIAPESLELTRALEDSTFNVETVPMPWPAVEFAWPNGSGLVPLLLYRTSREDPVKSGLLRLIRAKLPGSFFDSIFKDEMADLGHMPGAAAIVAKVQKERITSTGFDISSVFAPYPGTKMDAVWELFYRSARAAAALLVYCSVWPERIKAGLFSGETHGIRPASLRMVCSGDGEGSFTLSHFRRGHFRSLKAECFKRADDGSPRIVWVKPCAVSGSKDQGPVEAVTAESGLPIMPEASNQ